MKKNIIVILPIILSVITVAIFFNLSVKPMDTATNVLGQKETMSQNKNSKKNILL
jgi:ABC-type dipeptide/oligopeptide/nickel transport system permease component